jgi:acetaldehyde dehydrogenase (acetylating)
MGHTMSIHSKNDEVILQFGLKKPAFRICVNTPTTHGSIGLTTGLDPAMTLGCGGWGGNITSDNISPRHLLNIKRLAYELRPAMKPGSGIGDPGSAGSNLKTGSRVPDPGSRLPQAPAKPQPAGISAQTLASRIDSFLESRGYHAPADKEDHSRNVQLGTPAEAPAAFVCEDDVRAAMKAGRKVLIDEKTIVTPSARDLGEAQKMFVQAGWPR